MTNSGTLTVLGCGTSTGVPLIGCICKVCSSTNPKNNRLRASAWLNFGQTQILIDTSTDLRQQALREKIPRVDAVLYTHPHADHILGIDELRSFNFLQGTSIEIYGHDWTIQSLKQQFPYIFAGQAPKEGGGIPKLIPHLITEKDARVSVKGIEFQPLWLRHGSKSTLGYRVGKLAYLVDFNQVDSETMEKLHGLEVLVIDCLRIRSHDTHLNLNQALEMVSKISPKQVFLTHMGHDFEYEEWMEGEKLPKGVNLSFDGLKVSFNY